MNPQPDLRSFLDDLRENRSRDLLTISEEIPLDYSAPALAAALEKKGHRPVILLENLKGYNNALVANLFASRDVMAYGLGIKKEDFNAHMGESLDNLIPPEHTSTGPVQEIVLESEEADLTTLPIPYHFNGDAGPYITAGMLAAHDPDTGVCNLAYARLQVKGPQRMGVSLHSRQHLWDYHRRAAIKGKDLPVAVVIGAYPAVQLAAAAKMGIDKDEYALAGALLKQPLVLCKAKTIDVDVPVSAEIIIEGHILGNEQETEGPFGEFTGFLTGRSTNNVFVVSAITMRKDAIFVDIIPGNMPEHLTLGRASKEATVHKHMKEILPWYVDFHYPSSGTHFHCYVRIDKTAEGQAKQAAMLLLGLDHYIKLVVVVDKDIDPSDEAAVMWAMATRMQANDDVSIVSGVLCNQLDPSSSEGVGAKMIIDATRPLDDTATPISLPEEAEALALRLLSKAGL